MERAVEMDVPRSLIEIGISKGMVSTVVTVTLASDAYAYSLGLNIKQPCCIRRILCDQARRALDRRS